MLRASVDLPTPLGPDQDDVGGVLEEVERHQGFEGRAVATFGPGPIEVTGGFEAADMSRAQPAFQAAAAALLLLPVDERLDPSGVGDLGPVRQQAMQLEGLGTRVQSVEVTHLSGP